VPVVVAEAQLGAGVGVLSAADHPGTFRPGVQVEPAGQLAHLGTVADLAGGVDRWGPDVLGSGEIASRTWASIGIPSENPT
jgi:hypothetical protein